MLILFLSLLLGTLSDRVQAHLEIHDPRSAIQELKEKTGDHDVSCALVLAYAAMGEEQKMLRTWQDIESDPDLLEDVSWGVLQKGILSSSPEVRAHTVLAGATSHDARSLPLILKGLYDSNRIVRRLSAQMALSFKDQKIQDAVNKRLDQEQDPTIRQLLLRHPGALEKLFPLIKRESTPKEERQTAIAAWVLKQEDLPREEMERLATSPYKGLRLLACSCIDYLDLKRDYDLLLTLTQDKAFEVQAAAWQALTDQEADLPPLSIKGPAEVQISALWAFARTNDVLEEDAWNHWLNHKEPSHRCLAAAALATAGEKGIPLMQKTFATHQDPLVKLNLALGLIRLHLETEKSGSFIVEFLETEKEWISVEEKGIFSVYGRTKQEMPELENQMIRLELLNLLAILETPNIQTPLLRFVEEYSSLTTGAAAAILLTEGDEKMISLVKGLLKHHEKKIQVDAAILLAIWGEEAAVDLLIEHFPTLNREKKEQALRALSHVGSEKALPLMTKQLHAPSQTMRILAALSALQTLNH